MKGAIIGYTLTRTVGLPQANGDIGNWMEPLGLTSLYVEGALVALSAAVLLPRAAHALRRKAQRDAAAWPGDARIRSSRAKQPWQVPPAGA